MPSDYGHAPTLGLTMMAAFSVVGPRYGVRIEGIEDDANEHSDFWQEVAREMIASDPPIQARGSTPKEDGNG